MPNKILICAPPGDLRSSLENLLSEAGHQLVVVDDAAAAHSAVRDGRIDLVVADGLTVSAAVRSLRAASATGATPILVLAPGDDLEARIAFLEAGADDVLGAGFDARELAARVEALLIRHGQIPSAGTDDRAPGSGELIAFFSPKGGVGTTTLAVNTAVALARRHPDRTLLIDLDLQFGQAATHLNLVPATDIGRLVADEAAVGETDVALSYLTTHDSGLWVLAAPSMPDADARITADDVERVLSVLAPRFDRIVVDCGNRLDPRVMTVLERADTHVLIVLPELAALRAISGLMAFLGETTTLRARTYFVINRIFPKELLKTEDVEGLLQTRVGAEIAYNEVHVIRSINEGAPVVLSRPSSPPAVAITRLAEALTGPDTPDAAEPERRGLFRRR